VVQAARAQPPLRNLKAAALACAGGGRQRGSSEGEGRLQAKGQPWSGGVQRDSGGPCTQPAARMQPAHHLTQDHRGSRHPH
jgi:hypothetical protein